MGYSPNAADFKTVGVSAYDALGAHLEKRLSHNFQLGASYTWSHALDEQSDIGLFFTGDNPNHLRDSWASSDFDRTHVFSANFQVDAPNAARETTRRSPTSPTTGILPGRESCRAASPTRCTSSTVPWAASTSATSPH